MGLDAMLREIVRALPPGMENRLRLLARKVGPVRRAYRRSIAMRYYSDHLRQIREWAAADGETSNFYYDITDINRDQLAHLVSNVTGRSYVEVVGFFEELETDVELRMHLQSSLLNTNYGRDIKVKYGRRLGWYAFVRASRPRIVIETGVDHGVGSCVLSSALLRNGAEGFPGRYYGTDFRREAGQFYAGVYATVGQILYGDSIQSLKAFDQPIDLFVNDSDHSAKYEYDEYQTIKAKLSPNALILGDNSHATDSLSRFSRETGRCFLFFSEKPKDHWYPGAGIGISYQ